MSAIEEQRAILREAIEQSDPGGALGDLARIPVAWVVVVDWRAEDGRRWLSTINGDAGDDGLPDWQRDGLLRGAIGMGESELVDEEEG